MKKVLTVFLIAGLVIVFIWTLYFLYKKSEKVPVKYKTEKPFKTDIIKKAIATGTVIPRKEVLIKSNVSGIVEKIFVQAGKNINVGDIIAKIKIIPDMVSVNEAENRLARAKISLDQNKVELDRVQKLVEKEVLPKTDFIVADNNYKNSKQELEAAENNLQLIKEGATKNSGTATNTLIKSTIRGMILDIPIKEGNSVIQSNNFNEGTTIASIADMGQMIFEGKVDESEVGKLKQGMMLVMTVGAIESMKFDATLEYISPKGIVENGTVQFLIKAAVDIDKSYFLRANYSANADIVLDKREKVLALEESVLKFSGDSIYVEVEEKQGKYKRVKIETGISDGINIEVLKGLNGSEKIKGKEVVEEVKTNE